MKNKIAKERVIYDNYETWKTYPDEDMIENLVCRGYLQDEITDEDIWEERNSCDGKDWIKAKRQLKEFFSKGKWIAFGTVGRWNGLYNAGTIFDDFEKFFYRATEDCNYWKFYDENGHLYLTCSHHDGTCHYEIKELTDKGIQYIENWEDNWNDKRTDKYVHTQIINKYSRLPRFAEKVYGCKRTEYQPITKEALINRLNNQAKSFYC